MSVPPELEKKMLDMLVSRKAKLQSELDMINQLLEEYKNIKKLGSDKK
jgi:hypothetical protein